MMICPISIGIFLILRSISVLSFQRTIIAVRLLVLFETIFSEMIFNIEVIMRGSMTLLLSFLVFCTQTTWTRFVLIIKHFSIIKSGRPFERMQWFGFLFFIELFNEIWINWYSRCILFALGLLDWVVSGFFIGSYEVFIFFFLFFLLLLLFEVIDKVFGLG